MILIRFFTHGSVLVLAVHDVELALDLGDQIVEHVGRVAARTRITSAIKNGINATPPPTLLGPRTLLFGGLLEYRLL